MYTDSRPSHFVETAMSYAAGFLYAVGFYLWVDATAVGANNNLAEGKFTPYNVTTSSSSSYTAQKEIVVHVLWYHWFPLIIGTLGIFMVNLPPHNAIFGDESEYASIDFEDSYSKRVKAWLLISFIVSFISIICAIWMSVAKLLDNNITNTYPGIMLIVSTVLIFLSNVTYRFQRAFETQDEF